MIEVAGLFRIRDYGGMDMQTEHDRQLAEKLKSLSLQPLAVAAEPQRGKPRILAGAVLIAACAMAAVTMLAPGRYLPGAMEQARNSLAQTFASKSAAPTEIGLSSIGNGDAAGATDGTAMPSTKPAAKAPVAPRSIAGSGHVKAPVFAAVFPKHSARIISVAVDVGDRVSAGRVIARLEDPDAVFKLKEAIIAKASAQLVLDAARLEMDDAQTAAERLKGLAAQGAVAKIESEKALSAKLHAQNNTALAEQALAKSEVDYAKAEADVHDLDVIAPISGTVTARMGQVGETALSFSDSGKDPSALITITDTTNLVIDVDIAESSLALVQTGLPGVAVLDGFPDKSFAVEVSRVAPVASIERGTVGLRLTIISPPQGIRPNMAARVTISGSTNVAIADQNQETEQ